MGTRGLAEHWRPRISWLRIRAPDFGVSARRTRNTLPVKSPNWRPNADLCCCRRAGDWSALAIGPTAKVTVANNAVAAAPRMCRRVLPPRARCVGLSYVVCESEGLRNGVLVFMIFASLDVEWSMITVYPQTKLESQLPWVSIDRLNHVPNGALARPIGQADFLMRRRRRQTARNSGERGSTCEQQRHHAGWRQKARARLSWRRRHGRFIREGLIAVTP